MALGSPFSQEDISVRDPTNADKHTMERTDEFAQKKTIFKLENKSKKSWREVGETFNGYLIE